MGIYGRLLGVGVACLGLIAPAAAESAIVGHLVDASGTPAANVKVRIYPTVTPSNFHTTLTTNSEGNYEAPGLEGSFRVGFEDRPEGLGSVTKFGFLPSYFSGKVSFTTATVLAVRAGETVRADAVLHRPGSVSGHVTDAAGKPIAGVCVQAGTGSVAVTDASGAYVSKLPDSAYSSTGGSGGEPGTPSEIDDDLTVGRTPVEAYRPTDYPCAEEATGPHTRVFNYSGTVPVPEDTTVPNINFTLGSSTCVVPKLAGRTLAAARRAIKAAGCVVGKVVAKAAKPSKRGKVISQTVRAGRSVARGTRVGVTVGR